MIKLDAFDKRILEALIENSREQVSTIAKKIKLRRENTAKLFRILVPVM